MTNDTPVAATVSNTPPQQAPQSAQQPQQAPVASPSQPGGQQDPAAQQADLSGGKNTAPDLGSALPANVHPSIQRASLIHSIAQTLAGGPRYTYDIDVSTGKMISRPAPMSKSDIGMAIAMEAISGALSGLAAFAGPNPAGRAAVAGLQTTSQQLKQADAEQQQAAGDTLARSASIAHTNFQNHENAVRLGQMEYDAHKQYVSDAAPVLENLNQVGAVQASRVREDDLLSRFHVTKDMAVVDGIVPRMSPDGTQAKNQDGSLAWDNTYSVIDPEAKIEIPQDTMAMLAQHHVPGYYKVVDGKTVPVNLPSDTQVRAKFVVNGLASASAIKITEASLNKQLASVDDSDDANKLDVNLTQALESGAVSTSALRTFARYSSLPLDQIRPAMEKDKVDPDTIGQLMALVPSDAVEALKQQRNTAERYAVIDTPDKAEAVLAAPTRFTPDQRSAAQRFIGPQQSAGIGKAVAEARAHAKATGADLEAMWKFGTNPVTGERLSLTNAPDAALVTPTGTVVPQNLVSLYKPTAQQKQTADTARQVLAISNDLQQQVAKNPALIGPLAARDKQGLAKLGLGSGEAQKLLDDVSLLQSAVTKMHTGRFSNEILKKSGNLITPGMNGDQFNGAISSIQDVANRYAQEDQLRTVADWKQQQQPSQGTQPQQQKQGTPAPMRSVQIPAGAQIGRDAKGNVVGYKLNGQYVPLGGQ